MSWRGEPPDALRDELADALDDEERADIGLILDDVECRPTDRKALGSARKRQKARRKARRLAYRTITVGDRIANPYGGAPVTITTAEHPRGHAWSLAWIDDEGNQEDGEFTTAVVTNFRRLRSQ